MSTSIINRYLPYVLAAAVLGYAFVHIVY